MLLQHLEAQQAEQKGRFSSALADVNGRALQLQQEVAACSQQLQQEEAKSQQLGSHLTALQHKTALLSDAAGAASTRARYTSF